MPLNSQPSTLNSPDDPRWLAGRRRHLHRIWASLAAAPDFPQLDKWLALEMAREHGFGKRDRQWYSSQVFSAIRFAPLTLLYAYLKDRGETASLAPERLYSAAAEMARRYADPVSLRAALFALPAETAFAVGEQRSCWPASTLDLGDPWTALAHLVPETDDLDLRLTWNGMPSWLAPFVRARAARSGWPTETVRSFVDMQSCRPPVWLRTNDQSRVQAIAGELRAKGRQVAAADGALAVGDDSGVSATDAFRRGEIEIQDFASQMIGRCVDAHSGESVWDCCAGGGGKTVQIAAALHGSGLAYASDIRAHALRETRERLARGGLTNVSVFAWDMLRAERPPEIPHGGCDWVLLDAPCSGSGTWRRNPDGRLRFAAGELDERVDCQSRLLASASTHVKSGGHVIYATCSWFCQENEEVVGAFLRDHPRFGLERESLFGCPSIDADTTYAAVIRAG